AKVSSPSGTAAGLVARWSGTADSNYYYADIVGSSSGAQARIMVNLGGTFYQIAQPVNLNTNVGTLRLEVVGNTQKLFFDDGTGSKLVAFAFDTNLTGPGTVGMRAAGAPNAVSYDDFSVSAITPTNVNLSTPFADDFNSATRQQLDTHWNEKFGN